MNRTLHFLFTIFFALSFFDSTWAMDQPADVPRFVMKMPEDSVACAASLQKKLESTYFKYNHACVSGNFDEFQKYITEYQANVLRKALASLSKEELSKRKKVLQEMASKSFSVQELAEDKRLKEMVEAVKRKLVI